MPDSHDGPISEGIRDAIRASDLTPYAIAKEVTRRGKVKLTGPQIYRFIKGYKGLSLAILDEIARVLHLAVRMLPPEDRKAEGSPHRIVLKERMDRLESVAADISLDHDQRIWALDRTHQEIRKENVIKGDEIHTLYHLYSALRDRLRGERDAASEAAAKPKAGLCKPGQSKPWVRRSVKARRRPTLDVDDDEDDAPQPTLPAPDPVVVNGVVLRGDEPYDELIYVFGFDLTKVDEYLASRGETPPANDGDDHEEWFG
jgi:hypothetical protein